MSLLSVGASGFGDPSQILARMLSRLDSMQATNADASANAAGNTSSTNFAAPEPDASTAVTGTDQSRLSDQILALLVQLQQQTAADASQTTNANNGSAPGSGSTISAPVHALFSAMDSNGDGTVTQSEMENYIQQQGGTQSQADKLFTALTQNGSGGISENQLASDIAQGQKAHHHQDTDAPPSSSGNASSADLASQIFAGLDSNQDGTLSAAELTSAGLGTTDPTLSAASSGASSGASSSTSSSSAPNSLASLDSNGDGTVSANEFATFFASLELQIQSDTATMANLMQQASQAYSSAAGDSCPPSVVQSA